MHKKHADKGLVVMMVSVDDPDEKERLETAQKVVHQMKPPFLQLRLDESSDLWEKKLDFTAPPCYYLFDRQGKWVRFRGSDYKETVPYDEMEKVVVKMLSEK